MMFAIYQKALPASERKDAGGGKWPGEWLTGFLSVKFYMTALDRIHKKTVDPRKMMSGAM